MALLARAPDADLRPELAMCFYSDESCQNGHRFLVITVLAIFSNQVPNILKALVDIRQKYNQTRELGWTCVSKYKYALYEEWLAVLEAFAAKKLIRVTSLVLDTSERDDKRHNEGNLDIGFNKLLYQLLLHRVGKKYGATRALFGYLDSRTTKNSPEELRAMLNAGLAKDPIKIHTRPFRRLVFVDSKKSDLIQLVDIIAGGLAFHWNGYEKLPNVRPEKVALSKKIRAFRRLYRIAGWQFDIWEFHYKEGRKSLGFFKPPR